MALKIYLFITAFVLTILTYSLANAGVIYYGGGEGVMLENAIRFDKSDVSIISGSLDPSSDAVSATSGSVYFSDNGKT